MAKSFMSSTGGATGKGRARAVIGGVIHAACDISIGWDQGAGDQRREGRQERDASRADRHEGERGEMPTGGRRSATRGAEEKGSQERGEMPFDF